jgi:hypothetical protein
MEKGPVARFSPDLWKLHWKLYCTLTHWACNTVSTSWVLPEPNESWDGLPRELIGPRYTIPSLVFSRAAISFLQSKGALPAQQTSFYRFMDLPIEIPEMVIGYAFDDIQPPLLYGVLDSTAGWPHHGYREVFIIDSKIRTPDKRYIGAAELENLLATSTLSHSLLHSMIEVVRLHLVFYELTEFNHVMPKFSSLARFIRSLTFRSDVTFAALRKNTDVYPESISQTLLNIRETQQNMQRIKNLKRVTLTHFCTQDTWAEELLRKFKDFLNPDIVLECRCQR